MVTGEKRHELQHNYRAFLELLPSLIEDHKGEYALMRHGRIVAYFASPREALLSGQKDFPDDIFSVQEVRNERPDLGWYSRVPGKPPL